MTPESALAYFVAIFIFAITPGPGVFALLAQALALGARSCLFLALGMAVSDVVYLLLACFGLAAIAQHWSEAFTVIRIAGAAYLIYLGVVLWRARAEVSMEAPAVPAKADAASFVRGFLISASNPKVVLFYLAFLPTFMDLTQLSTFDVALASVLTLVSLMLGLMLIAVSAARARHRFNSPEAMRTLNRSAGSIMVGAGIYLAAK